MNYLIKGLLLGLLIFPYGSYAQCPYPILECHFPNPGPEPNRVICQLQWAVSPDQATVPSHDSCFTRTPMAPIVSPSASLGPGSSSSSSFTPSLDLSSITGRRQVAWNNTDPSPSVDDAVRPPRWIFSWDMGNGHYMVDTTDQIEYLYAEAGTYNISVQARSIYSPDEDPTEEDLTDPDPKRIVEITSGAPPNNLVTPSNSNFAPADNQVAKLVKITPQIRAAQPGDQMTIAVSLRQFDNIGATDGALFINLPKDAASLASSYARLNSRFGTLIPITSIPNNSVELYQIDYSGLSINEERTFFITLEVDSDTDVSQVEVEAGIIPGYDDTQNVLDFFGLSGNDDNFSAAGKPDGGGGGNASPNPNYIPTTTQGDSIHLRVNKSRDPNAIICDATIKPGVNKTLQCRIDFENLGLGDALEVITESHFPNQLDPQSTVTGTHFPVENLVNVVQPGELALINSNAPLTWQFDTTGIALQSLVLTSPFYAPQSNKGFVNYSVKTKPGLQLNAGDTIEHRALILMDGDSLWTDPFHTAVVAPLDIALPWNWGIRVGAQAQESAGQDAQLSGFHLGLNFRKAFGKVDPKYANKPFLGPKEMPEWYFLGEVTLIALQQFKDDLEIERQLWHSDLVPGIFYAPRALQGRVAVHGGGFGSVRWSAKVNEAKQDLSGNNRWEYGWYAGLSLGNNIGRPGGNLGLRLYRRFGELAGQQEDYFLYQLYLQFTF